MAAPDFAAEVAQQIADELPQMLRQRISDDIEWDVRRSTDPRAGDAGGGVEIIDAVRERMLEEGWDLAVCLTDLPIRIDGRPVVADASTTHGVGIVSLPALGATRVPERALDAVVRLVAGLVGARPKPDGDQPPSQRERFQTRLDELAGFSAERGDGSLRLVAGTLRGHLRLLLGMVRANRPWRVVVALSRAVIAALSTVAIATVNSNVWELGDALGWPRLLAVAGAATTALVASLILAHHLWERPPTPSARGQAVLFNAATLVTLSLGVLCLYAGLFVISLVAATVVIQSTVLQKHLGHSVALSDYLTLAWMVSSLAIVGGALGSGLESDESVRAAAYGYRPDARTERDSQLGS